MIERLEVESNMKSLVLASIQPPKPFVGTP